MLHTGNSADDWRGCTLNSEIQYCGCGLVYWWEQLRIVKEKLKWSISLSLHLNTMLTCNSSDMRYYSEEKHYLQKVMTQHSIRTLCRQTQNHGR